ncbi:hypothetical protein U9M48_012302, partial [Paspalum notatum var. saurae]
MVREERKEAGAPEESDDGAGAPADLSDADGAGALEEPDDDGAGASAAAAGATLAPPSDSEAGASAGDPAAPPMGAAASEGGRAMSADMDPDASLMRSSATRSSLSKSMLKLTTSSLSLVLGRSLQASSQVEVPPSVEESQDLTSRNLASVSSRVSALRCATASSMSSEQVSRQRYRTVSLMPLSSWCANAATVMPTSAVTYTDSSASRRGVAVGLSGLSLSACRHTLGNSVLLHAAWMLTLASEMVRTAGAVETRRRKKKRWAMERAMAMSRRGGRGGGVLSERVPVPSSCVLSVVAIEFFSMARDLFFSPE